MYYEENIILYPIFVYINIYNKNIIDRLLFKKQKKLNNQLIYTGLITNDIIYRGYRYLIIILT